MHIMILQVYICLNVGIYQNVTNIGENRKVNAWKIPKYLSKISAKSQPASIAVVGDYPFQQRRAPRPTA
jgi:hypothetical protein